MILFIPFRYRVQGHKYEEEVSSDGIFSWLFGLLAVSFSISAANHKYAIDVQEDSLFFVLQKYDVFIK